MKFCTFFFFKKDFVCLFLERGEGREKERERNINVWLPLMLLLLGTWPATQACALTGIRTHNPLLCSPVLNPLSHISQGHTFLFQFDYLHVSNIRLARTTFMTRMLIFKIHSN